ncbi:T9SS type A sorting domain-containing protein [Hymenobacter sp. DH14]|uniref:T9SS type A sorting domain-containing protein n=1 Tax=Hymenobacter cyanobacteriorum TaxID=2926463 RepID=A0A9X1VJS2_9BACT|nr:T9SS type A sorting domain-containing protein [Hymenobacter cyanobacteriorum]MCI1190092.1 T9SS type A sorting domain-containing protein [Hymenobacter cyanobacteriorum]
MRNFTKLILTAALVASGAAASAQTLYDNFEATRLVSYPTVLGTFTQNTPNPGTNAVNSSSTCALYTRDGAQQYAVIVVKPNNAKMADVSAYAAGTKKISVKFRSPAAGVVVQAVLQNSTKSNTNQYPNGKYAGDFNATTSVVNGWETLTFTFTAASTGNFDPTVTAADVDQLVLLVAPGTNNAATYYLDDLMGPELLSTTPPPSNMAVRQLYDNYEGTRALKYVAYKTSGGLKLDTLNNSVSAGNTSARVARYTRSTNQYDSFVMQPRGAALADVTNFRNNTVHMTLKVFSPAPGIAFQITLQDSTVAGATNYPAGRNSEYTATTTATNAWETLSFNYVNTPSATPNTGLNEIVLLVAPNTLAKRKIYLDDFYGPSLVGYVPTATRTVSTDFAAFAPAYPNPTSGLTQLPFSLKQPATVSLAVYDNLGRRVAELLHNEPRPAGPHTAELNAAKLAPGLYTCRLTVDGVALSRPLSVE